MKTIKVSDDNYRQLMEILHEIELESNRRTSFDDALSHLIKIYTTTQKPNT